MSESLLGLLVFLLALVFVTLLWWLRPLKQGFRHYMVVEDGD